MTEPSGQGSVHAAPSNPPSEAKAASDGDPFDYARAMGTALLGLLGDRPAIHLKAHPDNGSDLRSAFRSCWFNALAESDQDKFQKSLASPKPLFLHAATDKAAGKVAVSNGSWVIPCSSNECDMSIDLPLPPSPASLKEQIRTAGLNLYSEFAGRDVRLQRSAAAMVQRNLYAALCNIPHVCYLFAVQGDETALLRTSLDAHLESVSVPRKPDDRLQKEMVGRINGGEIAGPLDRNGLAKILFGEKASAALQGIIGDEADRELNCDALSKFLLWDRLGRASTVDDVVAVWSLLGRPQTTPFAEYYDQIERRISDKDFVEYEMAGLLYRMGLNAAYFLAAMVISNEPASILNVRLTANNEQRGEFDVVASFMVPNFTGLNPFLEKMTGLTPKSSVADDIGSYWNEDKLWVDVRDCLHGQFQLPLALGKLLLRHPKNSCDCKTLDTAWFTEHEKDSTSSVHIPDGRSDIGDRESGATSGCNEPNDWCDVDKMEETLEERLDLQARQLWVLRVENKNSEVATSEAPAPDFAFVVSDLKKESVHKTWKKAGHAQSERVPMQIGNELDELKKKRHQPVGIVGHLFAALIPSAGTSTCGDLRTLKHMNAHAALVVDKQTTSHQEATLYVNDFQDFYAFPIWVSDRLWGILAFQTRPYGQQPEKKDASREQFMHVFQGMSAAVRLGRRIEAILVDRQMGRLRPLFDAAIMATHPEDQNSNSDRQELSKAIAAIPCFFSPKNDAQGTDPQGQRNLFKEFEQACRDSGSKEHSQNRFTENVGSWNMQYQSPSCRYVDGGATRIQEFPDVVDRMRQRIYHLAFNACQQAQSNYSLNARSNAVLSAMKKIVEPQETMDTLVSELLPELVRYAKAFAGAMILFPESCGWYYDDSKQAKRRTNSAGYDSKSMSRSDTDYRCAVARIVEPSELKRQIKQNLSGREKPFKSQHCIFNKLGSPYLRFSDDGNERVTLVPIQEKQVQAGSDGTTVGVILLLTREEMTEELAAQLDPIPMQAMVVCARDMPFRAYEKRGLLRLFGDIVLGASNTVAQFVCDINSWPLISAVIGLLSVIGVYLCGFLAPRWPELGAQLMWLWTYVISAFEGGTIALLPGLIPLARRTIWKQNANGATDARVHRAATAGDAARTKPAGYETAPVMQESPRSNRSLIQWKNVIFWSLFCCFSLGNFFFFWLVSLSAPETALREWIFPGLTAEFAPTWQFLRVGTAVAICVAAIAIAAVIRPNPASRPLTFWTAERFVLKSLIEAMRLAVIVIAFFMFVIPLWKLAPLTTDNEPADQSAHGRGDDESHTRQIGRRDGSRVVEALEAIDSLVMALTVVILAMGLVMLYQPRYVSQFGNVLPRWMSRFTRIETLKGTILTLVVLIISIKILEDFAASGLQELQVSLDVPAQKIGMQLLLMRAVAGFLVIIAIAGFIRLALKEDEHDSDSSMHPPAE